MINALPDYKLLYEESLKKLAEAEEKSRQTEEKHLKKYKDTVQQYQQQIQLFLHDANELRRKLFGIKGDKLVKSQEGQLEIFTLNAQKRL